MFDETDALWLGPYAVDAAGDCDNLFDGLGDAAPDLDAGETFSIYDFDGPGAPPARIVDFDKATDALYIQYAAAEAAPAPRLEVLFDASAGLTRITLDGVEVASVDGDAGLALDDITLVAMP